MQLRQLAIPNFRNLRDLVIDFATHLEPRPGAANTAAPQAIPYRKDMTLLDVMIQVGGLAEAAAGNRAKIIRRVGGEQQEIRVKVADLLNDGEISANVPMQPGDVLIIPESRL